MDANGQASTLQYDALDRRADDSVESDTAWTYHNGAYGSGRGLGCWTLSSRTTATTGSTTTSKPSATTATAG